MFKDKLQKSKAFTLVEILVAVAVFSIVVGIASGLFVSSIRTQRGSLAHQQLLDQTSYIMEYMGRAIRMAKKDMDGACTGGAKLNYAKTDSKIMFKNYEDECQEFFREWDDDSEVYRLKEKKAGDENYLTSPTLNVVSFEIADFGWTQFDSEQPRTTLFLNVEGVGTRPEETPTMKLQTTISQRNPDVEK
jgi:prepilin-type N-terminal cleavage/methylation domain-containing protein